MALTLIATAGAADANSYATAAEGDTYHEGHLYATDWTGATTATKEAALVMATRLLDSMYEWAAYPTNTTQALQWPRNGVLDFLQLSSLDEDTIPERLKWATAELARQLIASNLTADSAVEANSLTSLRAGPVSLTFKESVSAKIVPDAVINLIPRWWGHLKRPSSGFAILDVERS